MSNSRRVLTYVAIALIVGAALALAVALSNSSGTHGTSTSSAGDRALASGVYSDTSGTTALAAADPAKEQPLLDKFTPKDPFIQFPTPGASSTSTPTPNPTSTAQSNLSAKVKVDGTAYNVMVGDKVPGGSAAAFTISAITSGDVTFKLIEGELKNGDTSITVNLGEAVQVETKSGDTYDLAVVAIGASSSGGGSGGSATTHSIAILSITSQNGTALVTLKVDGTTYSDKPQGAVIVTSFGEIKIIAIDVSAQTVTILHGDQTFTLHAGEVIVK